MTGLADQAKIAHAITGRDDILIGATHSVDHGFWPYAMGSTLYAPERGLARGKLDLGALWLANRHRRFGDFKPKDPVQENLAFLDLARCAALGNRYEGVRHNIRSSVEESLAHTPDPSFAEKTFLYAANHFLGDVMHPHDPDLARITKAQWGQLYELREDAEAFYNFASRMMENLLSPKGDDEAGDDTAPDMDQQSAATQAPEDNETPQESEEKQSQQQTSTQDKDIGVQDGDNTQTDSENTAHDAADAPTPNTKNESGEYHAFTTAYDAVIKAGDLGTREEALALRHTMDTHGQKNQALINRLARKLEAVLRAQTVHHIERDIEDGVLDTHRLARIVAKPDRRNIYQQQKVTPARNAVVSLLIDNSGSMRGRPILTAAIAADMMALTLERCGVPCEILGFTTANWKGGRSRTAWMEAGRPIHPGRLNDLAHIIYKDAATPWRKARLPLALTTKDSILKENIDGEALIWAAGRLMKRPEPRKILMVISDGAPVDDSTLSANDSQYLERHLRYVVKTLTARKDIELHAIGIGHDVTHTYPSSLTIRDVEELGPVLLEHLAQLFKAR